MRLIQTKTAPKMPSAKPINANESDSDSSDDDGVAPLLAKVRYRKISKKFLLLQKAPALVKQSPIVRPAIVKQQNGKKAASSSSDSDSDVPPKPKPISTATVIAVAPKLGNGKQAHETNSDSSSDDDSAAPPPAKVEL
jgi:hypothetical protein